MENFESDAPGSKQLHQYTYKRTRAQKLMWKTMKQNGWSCRYGRYYRPGQGRNDGGMNSVEAFQWYDSICKWLNG
jgi:hypothetical protein